MGVAFTVFKRSGGSKFELGKVILQGNALEVLWRGFVPSGNFETFKVSAADKERIASLFEKTLSRYIVPHEDDNPKILANEFVEWAKDEDLLLVPDTDSPGHLLQKFKFARGVNAMTVVGW